jgi:hypothetical protein
LSHEQLIAGRCTGEATAELRQRVCTRMAERVSLAHFRRFEGRWLSSIGLTDGCFTIDEMDLSWLIDRGLNLLDAGLPGAAGRSGLRGALEPVGAQRAALFVVARGGRIGMPDGLGTGAKLARIEETLVRPGVIGWGDLIDRSCIEPRYLALEIAESRRELGLATIDGYLLERPGWLLERLPPAGREQRLERAFEALEREAAAGAIGCYGVAIDAGEDLAGLLAVAVRVAGPGHRLRIACVPGSLGALDPRTTPEATKALALARAAADQGLWVLTACDGLSHLGALPVAYRNELPGLDGEAGRFVQICRSAPGVQASLHSADDANDLTEIAAVARTPPAAEAVRHLLDDD